MNVTHQHKATIITSIISLAVVLLTLSIKLKEYDTLAEIFIDVTPKDAPEKIESQRSSEQKEALKKDVTSTNKAYNETETYTRSSQAFEPVPPLPEDANALYNESLNDSPNNDTENTSTTEIVSTQDYIFGSEMQQFEKAKAVLAAQNSKGTDKNKTIGQSNSANTNSSLSYAMEGRTHLFLPTPIYLCEKGGKVVINITVNAAGAVIETSFNSKLSGTDNGCLIDHALEYAAQAIFNKNTSRPMQDGFITFNFAKKN